MMNLYGTYDDIVTKLFYRKISNPMSYFLVKHSIVLDPNLMTLFSFLSGLITGLSFALGYNVFAALFSQIWIISDCLNGEISKRLGKNGNSYAIGSILDKISDRICEMSIYTGICLYRYYQSGSIFYLWFLIFSSFYLLIRQYSFFLLYSKDIKIYRELTKKKNGMISELYGVIKELNGGFVMIIMFFSAILGFIFYFMIFLLTFYFLRDLLFFLNVLGKQNG
jgi:hypothetical protein